MISACGIDCETCPIFKAAGDPGFAEQLAADWRKTWQPKAEAGWFKCQGCHGDDALVWTENCAIRKCCVKDRQFENCSLCPDFPCELITRFESDGAAHHKAAVENLRRMKKTTWQRFFDAHAAVYDQNVFTKNTVKEVDFLLEELGLEAGSSILDVACGTGRHAVELAGRGYAVTGLDLSAEMLAKAASAADAAGVHVEWIHADATRFSLPSQFDAAICLCEGAFGLLGQGDDPISHPLSILCNISRSLKPQAKAIFTVLSAARMLRGHTDEEVVEGRFDPLTLVESGEHPPREGLPAIAVRERGFIGTELTLLFRLAGMCVVNMWGGTAGNWGRRPLELDEFEVMIVASKAAEPTDAVDSWRCP